MISQKRIQNIALTVRHFPLPGSVMERSLFLPSLVESRVVWERVTEWIVVIKPSSIPNLSFTALTSGASPFVVHEAHEMMSEGERERESERARERIKLYII
jgi:hypothetical protein